MNALIDRLKADLELAEKARGNFGGFGYKAKKRWPATTKALIKAVNWIQKNACPDGPLKFRAEATVWCCLEHKTLAEIEKELE